MTCRTARELFSAVADGALAAEERAALDMHLAACPDCRRELARFEATVGLLRAVEPARAPVGFVSRVVAAAGSEPWHVRLRRRLVAPLALRRPVQVTVLLLVVLTALHVFRASEVGQLQEHRLPRPPADTSDRADLSGRRTPSATSSAPPASSSVPLAAPPKSEPTAPSGDGGRRVAEAPHSPAPTPTPATPEPARSAPASSDAPASGVERRATEVDELQGKSAAARPPSPAGRPSVPADVSGTLTVADRDTARREIAELLGRLGAIEVGGGREATPAELELVVPAARYAELADGLRRLGRWEPDREPADLPAGVRVLVRLEAD